MSEESFHIADAARVEDAIDTLAAEIATTFRRESSDVVLVGILRRGSPIAKDVAERMNERYGADVEVSELKLKRYSDELELIHDEPELDEEPLDVDVEGKTVVLVDDVIYSGRTAMKAAWFMNQLDAKRVHTAFLCARGPQELPVKADFVAMTLDVGPGAIVDVNYPPFEEECSIVINRKE